MYFLLYAHNQVVEGKEKSAIYDLENSTITYIPTAIIEVLEEMRTKTVAEIKQKYAPSNPEIIDDYISFFLEKELGFYTEEPSCFPKLDTNFYYPGTIQNAIIESDLKLYDVKKVLTNLDELGCHYLEIRLDIDTIEDFEKLKELLHFVADTVCISIDILLKYRTIYTTKLITDLYASNPKIGKIVIYEAPENNAISKTTSFTKHTFEELESKQNKTSKYIVNIPFFCESLHFNTTYNKKVAITYKGQIKNILKDSHDYGNVAETDLIAICESTEFQKWWTITVDKIETLKDSPLRYALYNPFPIKELSPNKFLILAP